MKKTSNKIYNPPLLKFVSTAAIIYFCYYIWWRATATINPEYPFFSWLLLAAEAFGVLTYILFSWITSDITPIIPFKKPANGLKVDIYIPTFNENSEILEATLIGCRKVRYPHTTYVLDDGNRPQIRDLAARLNCEYIARPTHEHAKAGNINYALHLTAGDFIVVLDADMVPQPEYLDRTLGYFEDEKLALVQLPQEFYNRDSIQHASNKTSWHEQSLFFRVIQPGKNYTNSAFWCGSPSVVRRKALVDVGGVATETITEDIHTSVRLHSRGWKTLFVNEPLAFGIAPQTINSFLIQRLRWAQGTMQLYRSKESPFWIPGLTWKQRLSYISSFSAYLESFQKFILISMPILILGFDIFPMKINFVDFILRWSIYFILNIVVNQLGGRGVFQYFKTEKFNLLKTVIFIQATFTLFIRKPLKFKVTPKNVEENVYRREGKSMLWFMVFLGTLVGAMGYGFIRIVFLHTDPISLNMALIAFFWAIYNSFLVYLAIHDVFSKKHERKQFRFPIQASGKLHDGLSDRVYATAQVLDLSITGAGILMDGSLPNGAQGLDLEIDPIGFNRITIPVENVFRREVSQDGKMKAGILFKTDLGLDRERLFEYLFIYLPVLENRALYRVNKWDPFRTLENQYQNLS